MAERMTCLTKWCAKVAFRYHVPAGWVYVGNANTSRADDGHSHAIRIQVNPGDPGYYRWVEKEWLDEHLIELMIIKGLVTNNIGRIRRDYEQSD